MASGWLQMMSGSAAAPLRAAAAFLRREAAPEDSPLRAELFSRERLVDYARNLAAEHEGKQPLIAHLHVEP